MNNNRALLLFVRNPEKGKVKTRLAKELGDDKALEIYLELLNLTRAVAMAIPAERLLFYSNFIPQSDDWPESLFQKHLQSGGDLGARMEAAFHQALETHPKAVIIGSDCPELRPEIIEQAFTQLDDCDAVFGPANDGGYYLLGLKSVIPGIFRDMVWSTKSVLSETLDRLKAAGKTYAFLPELSDVDHVEDWERYLLTR
ncbi:MAG: TIGR04282 family arsenosugar biosynthesis glycosyltransferase [Saprospiraceae bacterium]|nr:TIGR04282 family arsenosugar biosynthesis glycosyltransferase [Saprospiraceae bacterium]